jgi:hypothetical protein
MKNRKRRKKLAVGRVKDVHPALALGILSTAFIVVVLVAVAGV